jgi:hypothetical protein
MRLLILGAFLLTLMFAVTLGAIRATPLQENVTVRDFVNKMESCAPQFCMMNLQPGVTSTTQAGIILNGNRWVRAFRYFRGMALGSGMITWSWSGEQPAYINGDRDGTLWIEDDRVYYVEIPSRINFADLYFIEPPERGAAFTSSAVPPRMIYWGLAHTDGLQMRAEITCPARVLQFWNAPLVIRIGTMDSALRNADISLNNFSPVLECPSQ